MEKVGHSSRLELPETLRVNPVFAPEKLRRGAVKEPLPGQAQDPRKPIEIEDHEEWEVEEILASRIHYRKLQYRVKWVGHYPDPPNAWYPASNFMNAPNEVKRFHERYPDKDGPPMRLLEWLQAAEGDRFLSWTLEDELPAKEKPNPKRK
jgi:hypothetical protein